jgi:putative FmdB family regulatory protein
LPTYSFRCPDDHLTEGVFKMTGIPEHLDCECGKRARRVFEAPAAIHFKAGGFYQTDVREKLHRRRRPNAGDDLHREYDHAAAHIADGL